MASNLEAALQGLRNEALHIRRNRWRALHAAGGGHVGGSVSAADLFAALYFHHLRIRPDQPDWPDRDRFVLSKGHANAGLAAVLARAGFIDDALLDRFYGYESPLGMHPDIKVAGVEMCTGGLGHGLSVGLGMALGARLQDKEAAMAAAKFGLANLCAIVDYNKVQQSGRIEEMNGLDPLADKWRAFGWMVREIDGHDMAAIVDALDALPFATDAPSLLIAHTIKGKGVSFAEDTYLWHNNAVTDEILASARAELGDPA